MYDCEQYRIDDINGNGIDDMIIFTPNIPPDYEIIRYEIVFVTVTRNIHDSNQN